MTAWLITGGAGFIGANFVRMAADDAVDTLIVLDALTYAGNIANISDLVDAGRVQFHKGAICDVALVDRLFGSLADKRGGFVQHQRRPAGDRQSQRQSCHHIAHIMEPQDDHRHADRSGDEERDGHQQAAQCGSQ